MKKQNTTRIPDHRKESNRRIDADPFLGSLLGAQNTGLSKWSWHYWWYVKYYLEIATLQGSVEHIGVSATEVCSFLFDQGEPQLDLIRAIWEHLIQRCILPLSLSHSTAPSLSSSPYKQGEQKSHATAHSTISLQFSFWNHICKSTKDISLQKRTGKNHSAENKLFRICIILRWNETPWKLSYCQRYSLTCLIHAVPCWDLGLIQGFGLQYVPLEQEIILGLLRCLCLHRQELASGSQLISQLE